MTLTPCLLTLGVWPFRCTGLEKELPMLPPRQCQSSRSLLQENLLRIHTARFAHVGSFYMEDPGPLHGSLPSYHGGTCPNEHWEVVVTMFLLALWDSIRRHQIFPFTPSGTWQNLKQKSCCSSHGPRSLSLRRRTSAFSLRTIAPNIAPSSSAGPCGGGGAEQ